MRVRIFTDELDADGDRTHSEYPLIPLTQATLRELIEIKTHTGLSGAQIEADYQASIMARAASPGDYDLSGDVGALRMVTCVIWLSRRRAGSKATLADAEEIRLDNWTFVADTDDAGTDGEGEADPTRPGSGGPETPAADPSDPSGNPPPPNSGPSTT